jgi:hypothetical protein
MFYFDVLSARQRPYEFCPIAILLIRDKQLPETTLQRQDPISPHSRPKAYSIHFH